MVPVTQIRLRDRHQRLHHRASHSRHHVMAKWGSASDRMTVMTITADVLSPTKKHNPISCSLHDYLTQLGSELTCLSYVILISSVLDPSSHFRNTDSYA